MAKQQNKKKIQIILDKIRIICGHVMSTQQYKLKRIDRNNRMLRNLVNLAATLGAKNRKKNTK